MFVIHFSIKPTFGNVDMTSTELDPDWKNKYQQIQVI